MHVSDYLGKKWYFYLKMHRETPCVPQILIPLLSASHTRESPGEHEGSQRIKVQYGPNRIVSGDALPANTKHLYNICTTSSMLVQHSTNVIKMFCVAG